jgi:hypothetical protein
MAQHAPKSHVAPHQLQIGIADTGQPDPDQRLARRWNWVREVRSVLQATVADKSAHHRLVKNET